MRITKTILFIFLATALFASCKNDEVKSESVKQEENNKLAEKAKEQEENTVEYLENVNVNEIKVNWQKNLFWLIAQKISE